MPSQITSGLFTTFHAYTPDVSGVPRHSHASAHDSRQVLMFQGKSCLPFRSFTSYFLALTYCSVPLLLKGLPLLSRSHHQFIPIDLVGVDPVECGRVGEKFEKKRREPVPKPHLDRIGHDLPLTRAAPMLNHTLDARSTEPLIGRKSLL